MTGCGFMLDEMTRLLPLLMAEDSDALLKHEAEANEYLMVGTKATRMRMLPEFKRRYNAVPRGFWEQYLELSPRMQLLAMYYVLLKAYRIFFDFQVDVVRTKWQSFSRVVTNNDLLAALSDIACRDPFVDSWTDATRKRVAAAFRTAMRQVGFISGASDELRELDYADSELAFFARIGEPWFLDAILLPKYRIDAIKSLIS